MRENILNIFGFAWNLLGSEIMSKTKAIMYNALFISDNMFT